nr:MAG TPA: hypothetical protein [Caudoviricetes sp.]
MRFICLSRCLLRRVVQLNSTMFILQPRFFLHIRCLLSVSVHLFLMMFGNNIWFF